MAALMAAILFQPHTPPVGADLSAKFLQAKSIADKSAPTKASVRA
jgi:hypothetical protein